MRQIVVTQPFKFAHHGHQVEEFAASAVPRDTTDECADLAIAEGWAVPAGEHKARAAAPENKDAAPRRRVKTTT
jgi:hypothetical protein